MQNTIHYTLEDFTNEVYFLAARKSRFPIRRRREHPMVLKMKFEMVIDNTMTMTDSISTTANFLIADTAFYMKKN